MIGQAEELTDSEWQSLLDAGYALASLVDTPPQGTLLTIDIDDND